MTATLRMILLVIVFALVGSTVFWAVQMWNDYLRLQRLEEQVKASNQATTETVEKVNTQVAERQRVEIVVSDRRAVLDRGFEELKREDQTVADWAATPIPKRLRELDAAEAIDRTPGAGDGREGDDRATSRRRPAQESR